MNSFRWILAACALPVAAAQPAAITVFAAASLADVLEEIGPRFTAFSGHAVRFNFAASGTLARQIEAGAPADVFLPADEARLEQLARAGLLLADTRRVLLANQLVLIVAAADGAPVVSLHDLTRPIVHRLALGDPDTVPAGRYARTVLEQQGWWPALAPKVLPLDNVRAVLAAVESGNAEAGFVYRTDALRSRQVKVAVEVPVEGGPKILYSVAVLRAAKHAEAARRFVDYLAGSEAQVWFAQFGFLPRPR